MRFKQNQESKHKLSKIVLYVAMLMFIFMTGMIDYLSQGEIGFAIFYVIYVAISAWVFGVATTSSLIILSSILRIVVLTKFGVLDPGIQVTYVNFALHLGVLFIIAIGVSYFRKSLNKQKQFLRMDAITNVGNAQFLRETLSKELSRAKRYSKPFSVIVAQSDSYEKLSARYGEGIAKSILKSFAQLFTTSLRETDECSFINENCFVMVLAEADCNGAKVVLDRLEQKLHSLYAQQEKIHECLLKAVSFEALPLNVDSAVKVIQQISETKVIDKSLAQWTYAQTSDDEFVLTNV